ncbi:MAG: Protein GrpE [Owenweeksia sp. TMED14]|nr:MAG: Protein GrpE [Owenweeksia sp. TMED14]|tara:strand:+ start:98 stop:640 length:543 start_codon:yes stop_codon:yes gene_type:complete
MAKAKKTSDKEKEIEDPKIENEILDSKVEETALISPEEQIHELKDQNLRLYAEFENFRKRNARERLDLMTTASEKVIKVILPVVDDFERALRNFSEDSKEREGLDLIYAKLTSILKIQGLNPMDSTIGLPLDVETMEAITTIPAPSAEMQGNVIDEVEKGYMLGSKIIRYAKVVVADSAK